MSKCLICNEILKKQDKKYRIKDTVLFIDGECHSWCKEQCSKVPTIYDIIEDINEEGKPKSKILL